LIYKNPDDEFLDVLAIGRKNAVDYFQEIDYLDMTNLPIRISVKIGYV
jgi:hypothetical protein